MRILFLTTVNLAENNGGTVYSSTISDALANCGDVKVVALSEYQQYSSRFYRMVKVILQSLFTGVPPNILFHSGQLTLTGMQQINQSWDLIVVDHLESAYSQPNSQAPVIYVSHNRESCLINQKIPRAPRWVRYLLSFWVNRYERHVVRSVDAVVTISDAEAFWYRAFNRHVEVVLPVFNNVVQKYVTRNIYEPLRIGFLGGAKWLPNQEALDLLVNKILPSTNRSLSLVIAGSGWDIANLSARLDELGISDRISLSYMGYVCDIKDFWLDIDVFMAPITSGAGVNVKVCEALANVRPVIALPHALRGLDQIEQDLIIRVDSPKEFAKMIDVIDLGNFSYVPPKSFDQIYATQKLTLLLDALL